MTKAIVLLSGGLDSYTAAAIAREQGFEIYALTVKYGQRHAHEILAARKVAEALGVKAHRELAVDLGSVGGSALVGDGDVPKSGPDPNIIPVTYVPARNTVMLSLALAWAEVIGAFDIFIGVNALDYSGYPDCRPEYIDAFERMATLATKAGVEGGRFHVRAPLISMSKAEIIGHGVAAWPRLRHHAQLLRSRSTRRSMRAVRQLRAARQRVSGSRSERSTHRRGAVMSSDRLYYTDSYLIEFDAVVRDIVKQGDRWVATLDRTAFYPTSGGSRSIPERSAQRPLLDVFDQEDGTVGHARRS